VGRRKKPRKTLKPKPSLRTYKQFADSARQEQNLFVKDIRGRRSLKRLSVYALDPLPLNPQLLTVLINDSHSENSQWILDTSFYLHETDKSIWEALLSKQGRLALTEPIGKELDNWLEFQDRNNGHLFSTVNDLKKGLPSAIELITFRGLGDIFRNIIDYYANLIGFRKNIVPFATKLFELTHEKSPNASELSEYIKKYFGERAQLIYVSATKSKIKANLLHDEATICIGILHSILSGRELCFLTADEGFFEQFGKTVALMLDHYYSFMAAELYYNDSGYYRAVNTKTDDIQYSFVGAVQLLERKSNSMAELLTGRCTPVPITCFLVKKIEDQQIIFQQSFLAEQEMSQLFIVKGTTQGLNTTRFDGKNFHVNIGTIAGRLGNYMAIGLDKTNFVNVGDHDVHFPHVDLDLVLCDSRPFAPTPDELPRIYGVPNFLDFFT